MHSAKWVSWEIGRNFHLAESLQEGGGREQSLARGAP